MSMNPVNHTRLWVLVATITASSMAFIDSTALNVALTALQKDLNATGAELIWIVNAYLLMLAAFILLGGSLGDHYGRNRIFRIGIITFAAASLICGLSPTVGVLIFARAIQGIGGALMVPGSLAILSASFSADERGKAIGIWSSVGTITTILAPALGGVLAGAGLWRGVFFINLPLAMVALFALAKVPETKDDSASRQLDYPGTILITVGLAGLTAGAISLGQASAATGARSIWLPIALLAAGIVGLAGFIIVEAHSDHPMIPLTLFRQRTFSGSNVMTVFLYGALSGTFFFLPLNLIQVQGYSADIAGLTMLPLFALLAGLSPLTGRLVNRFGPRAMLTVGPIIVGIAFITLALPGITHGPADYWLTYFPAIVILGVGLGITVAPLTTAVMGSVPSHEAGVASGVNNALTRSAQGLAIAIFGAVALISFTNSLTTRLSQSQISASMQEQIQQNASQLGNIPIPAVSSSPAYATVKEAIHFSFVDMFRLICGMSAMLAGISAAAAYILVEDRPGTADVTTEK